MTHTEIIEKVKKLKLSEIRSETSDKQASELAAWLKTTTGLYVPSTQNMACCGLVEVAAIVEFMYKLERVGFGPKGREIIFTNFMLATWNRYDVMAIFYTITQAQLESSDYSDYNGVAKECYEIVSQMCELAVKDGYRRTTSNYSYPINLFICTKNSMENYLRNRKSK